MSSAHPANARLALEAMALMLELQGRCMQAMIEGRPPELVSYLARLADKARERYLRREASMASSAEAGQ